MSDVVNGVVKWFSNERGYGFINELGIDDKEYFVHYSSINIDGYKTLTAGQEVTFALKDTDKGVQAVDVTPDE